MDPQNNNPPSPSSHKYNTRFKNKHPHKINYNKFNNLSDNDFIEENDNPLNIYNYRVLLNELFPSQNSKEKLADMNTLKSIIKSKRKRYNKGNLGNKKHKKQNKYNKDHTDNEYSDYEYQEDEEEDDNDDDESEFEYDEEDEEDNEYDKEEDDESEEEEEGDDDDDDESEEEEDEEDEEEECNNEIMYYLNGKGNEIISSQSVVPKLNSTNNLSNISISKLTEKIITRENSNDILKTLTTIANQENRKKTMNSGIKKYKEKNQEIIKIKIHQKKNVKEFKKLLTEKDNLNDLKYFKQEICIEKQDELIEELKQINSVSTVEKPYRIILLEANIPQNFKISALKKISIMENMDPSISEYFKLKNWIDTFMRIPFNKFNNLQYTIDNGIEKCNEYMQNSVDTLDKAVFGLNDAKMQIMQLVGQWIVNPSAVGSAIAIKGPMGTGKTTLVKEGISKILNRPFALIALGGATDASVLEGHGYTYEGSTWGKIVDILIQTKCSNPIIYFDELDKVSDTPKGEEIIGILTHLIDATQNGNFHDKYFSEIDFDLSKALFIFSYNDESKINPILRDRMYRISTKGYDKIEKKTIAKDYLIPFIHNQVKFEKDNIILPDETLEYIIENHTEKEDGVRNFKRCLEIIYTKLNLYRLMKSDSKLFKDEKSLKVEFPFTVTTEIVDKLIKKEKEEGNDNWKRLYN